MTRTSPSHIPVADHCSYPLRSGNRVTALIDGEPAFQRICEAVEQAQKSVFATIAFHDPDFAMPGDHGSLFDVLDRAKARGLDVRVIFWRTDRTDAVHFHGTDEDREMLRRRGSKFHARWDRAQRHYCQHQKSWLIDAGTTGEVAFVGGINLDPASVSAPGHHDRHGQHVHDVYVELKGPSASDVHHNFVQRWNEASERERPDGRWPDSSHRFQLAFPEKSSPPAGHCSVQVQRTVRAAQYFDSAPAPDCEPFDIANGEISVFRQYENAINAARNSIYIEDQYIASPEIIGLLCQALQRGVEVVFVAPAHPEPQVRAARKRSDARDFFERLGLLGTFENFTLAGLTARHQGIDESVYVHAKIAIVDDAWTTIGSCNIASQSFFCDTELNVSIWSEQFARGLRTALLAEHLCVDTAALSDRDALRLFHRFARENATARQRNGKTHGMAFALEPAQYGI